MLGYTEDELRQKTFRDLTVDDDLEASQRFAKQLLEGARHDVHIEKRYRRKDGGIIWARITASMIRDDDGKPLFTAALVEDITARK